MGVIVYVPSAEICCVGNTDLRYRHTVACEP